MSDKRHRLPTLLALSATLLTVPLVMGYWGTVHPAFDSLAHFRVHLGALVVVLALPLLLVQGWRGIGLTAAVLGGAAVASVTALPAGEVHAEGEMGAARYRLLQLNLRYDNRTPREVLSLIGREQPDVVTLNEASSAWLPELELIEGAYPHRIVCQPPSPIGGVAILSRRPFLHPSRAQCFDRGSLAIATVNFGGAAVDIAAIHLGWPWPFEQAWQIDDVVPVLERLSSSAIAVGDLNAAPWSLTARRVAAAGGLTSAGNLGPTWLVRSAPDLLRRFAGLPIDNVFTKGRVVPIATRRLESVGSDHLPVLLEFAVRPEKEAAEVMQARIAGE
ncbi:endonuclease/exonuclease/phosphatase family protein [Chelativorans alearense]|uniref:endonuclease/exonuclease/phosphatase family protein n=1 Tax=Chelativorans alearense TaxID=2681495 RepID=UPI0013D0328D|nr:endonuclease/exonuclease/phosphatase family protein [Chelativorans alearense]